MEKVNVKKGVKGFISQGKSAGRKAKVFSIRYPPAIQEILEILPNRSDKIREWVIAGMIREGLLKEEDLE